jgi:hypothetical protein
MIHPFRTVRIWELDPTPVLESNNPRLFPWAVVMKSSEVEVREIGAAVESLKDEVTLARFLTLGSIRYDRNRLEDFVGGLRMGFVEAIMEASSLVREAREKAAEEGRKEGREEGRKEGREEGMARGLDVGRVEEARRLLRSALQVKYPRLEAMPEIDAITSVGAVESILIDELLSGGDRNRVERAILAAVR